MSELLNQLIADTSRRFEQALGSAPRWVVAAPGRVNLIGEHIDYNDGFVLPMAIDRYTVIAAGDIARPSWPESGESSADHAAGCRDYDGRQAIVRSVAADDEAVISLAGPRRHLQRGHWSNYVAGVLAGCLARKMRPGGFNAVIGSDVPVGGGLSSSAALEVATATLVEAMTGITLEPTAKALLCQRAEHEFAGVPCGIMDQFAAVMCRADHLMLLDCRSQQVEQIPLTDPAVTVLVINSNVKHELAGGEYAERRGQCEAAARALAVASVRDATPERLEAARGRLKAVEYRRARHAIGEIARTARAADAVRAGDWSRVGNLMYQSHESLRDDYEVSCRELDLLVELARGIGPAGGVFGSRMTGGGFGGCTVSLVQTAKVEQVAQHIAAAYRRETGIEPTVLTSRPAAGAHVIQSG
jgi:galactokinase